MTAISTRPLSQGIREIAHPLVGSPADFEPLLARVGDASMVLIGEASHGTHEFYRVRAEITKQLIRTRGFTAVAVEADWPDALRVNRYVQNVESRVQSPESRGRPGDEDAEQALSGFRRYPQWMWRNADVLDFVGWLRAHNESVADEKRRVGFYGLDLYSLHSSMEAVVRYLRKIDPAAATRAEVRYGCFDRYGDDPQKYGYASTLGLSPSCEAEVVAQLVELRRAAGEYIKRDGRVAEDDLFFAEQNARVVANAERYYRAMFGSREQSWNLRDTHMAGTLEVLGRHLAQRGARRKLVVWAHNSHLGDARATEMSEGGELNVGQLVRQRYGVDAVLIGFSTYQGSVTATSNWDEPAQRKAVRPALPGSYEALFHEVGIRNFYVDLGLPSEATSALASPRLERAIGVIYRPETERWSHYFHARVTEQFDAVLYYDTTRAVEPLEKTGTWEKGEAPETYPTAL